MKYIKGDLLKMFFENQFDCIAHQANCQGLMKSGFAKALVNMYPAVRTTDVSKHYSHKDNLEELYGTYSYAMFSTNNESKFKHIINLYSQFQPGPCLPTGIDSFHMRCVMLEAALDKVNKDFKGQSIGIPLIASGLAANKWFKQEYETDLEYFKKFIAPIVEECLFEMDVTIVYL